jgi:hypothetical protein
MTSNTRSVSLWRPAAKYAYDAILKKPDERTAEQKARLLLFHPPMLWPAVTDYLNANAIVYRSTALVRRLVLVKSHLAAVIAHHAATSTSGTSGGATHDAASAMDRMVIDNDSSVALRHVPSTRPRASPPRRLNKRTVSDMIQHALHAHDDTATNAASASAFVLRDDDEADHINVSHDDAVVRPAPPVTHTRIQRFRCGGGSAGSRVRQHTADLPMRDDPLTTEEVEHLLEPQSAVEHHILNAGRVEAGGDADDDEAGDDERDAVYAATSRQVLIVSARLETARQAAACARRVMKQHTTEVMRWLSERPNHRFDLDDGYIRLRTVSVQVHRATSPLRQSLLARDRVGVRLATYLFEHDHPDPGPVVHQFLDDLQQVRPAKRARRTRAEPRTRLLDMVCE